ncbi:NAD(P)-binding protein [Aaosphaeria arxii CBS 175.79]|uniref:NAD(P)-binding protein n=1 Tax=Aaosphaeria arxii CBS 175.79 TaxID=1450172 RepID=A0A6A5XX30_9PLEO|nr:NAD(P)-binding protein [Aaosphaeria arxii CBS 175.79]KAF2017190.1 NAD(P)-binding protein [Aaosphaeria arxii CBS 175.79]
MSDIKNVILVGATGNLGPSVLDALRASSFNVTVLEQHTLSSIFPSDVKVIRADYDAPDALRSAFQGQDAVVLTVGAPAIPDQPRYIDAAIAAGVKRFIPSEFGSNTQNPRALELVPAFGVKNGVVDYLISKQDAISWTGIITGPFIDWAMNSGLLGYNAATKTVTLIDEGTGEISCTPLRQVGEAVVKSLENADLTKNQIVYVSSFQTSQVEILSTVEKLTGEKWTVKHITSKELFAIGHKKLSQGDKKAGTSALIKAAEFSSENLGDHASEGLWNEKLGLKKESFEEAIKAGLAGQVLSL